MIATFKNQNGGRSPIENKQLGYILETRISFLPSDNRKNLTWVFIRMLVSVR